MTSEEIIQKIKLFAELPDEGNLLYEDDQDILDIANSVLESNIFSIYRELDNSFFLAYKDYPLKATRFTLPFESENDCIYDVQLVDQNGNTQNMPISEISTSKRGFYLAGNQIFLQGYSSEINSGKYQTRIWFHMEPPKLVFQSQVIDKLKLSNGIGFELGEDQEIWRGFRSIEIPKNTSTHFDTFMEQKNYLREGLTLQDQNQAKNFLSLRYEVDSKNFETSGEIEPYQTHFFGDMGQTLIEQIEETNTSWIIMLYGNADLKRFFHSLSDISQISISPGYRVHQSTLPTQGNYLMIFKTMTLLNISEMAKESANIRFFEQLKTISRKQRRVDKEALSISKRNSLWE